MGDVVPTVPQNSLQRFANLYRFELDWAAIPTMRGTKRPAGRWRQFQERLPTETESERWNANGWASEGVGIGIVTGPISGITVIDIDNEGAANWLDRNATVPMTATATSQHGEHLYFETPGIRIRSATRVQGIPGLDVRGQGGFIVAPPSPFTDGSGFYTWRLDPRVHLAQMPRHLADLLQLGQKKQSTSRRSIREFFIPTPQGARNDTLLRLAGTLLARGLDEDDTALMMEVWNNLYARPPLSVAEVEVIAASLLRRHNAGGTNRAAFDTSQATLLDTLHENGASIRQLSRFTGRGISTIHRVLSAKNDTSRSPSIGKEHPSRPKPTKPKAK